MQIHDFGVYLGFTDTPDIVVRPESTLDIALWVKSKMAVISFEDQKLKKIYHFRQN